MRRLPGGMALAAPLLLAQTGPPPVALDSITWGTPSFDERFRTFDWGADQQRPARPPRWPTVAGNGGALSRDNRGMSETSIATDARFTGVKDGRVGDRPLGLDPYLLDPGGGLSIVARPTPVEARPWMWNAPYYSGAISTKFSFSQRFGYFEIEARLPAGKGLWPAFWLMPLTGQWPDAGEIDIFENLGDPRVIYCTVIVGKDRPTEKIALPFDASADFHRYGLLWTPDALVWTVDRRPVLRRPTPAVLRTQPMYIIANLAVGGAWGGQPDATTRFPARYSIRRITAWPLPPSASRR